MKINEFKLERFFAKYEFTTEYILSSSDSETLKIDDLFKFDEKYLQEFLQLPLHYTETQGSPELREQISKMYRNISKDDIILFNGSAEGIFAFFNSMLNEDDHIIVQFPTYPALYEVAKANRIQVTKWEMDENDGWGLNQKTLRTHIENGTKAIVLNTPNNPTGHLLSRDEINDIVNLCREHKLILFSDEVFRFHEYDISHRLDAIADIYDNGVSLGSLSKPFGLPGLRIGWIASKNKNIISEIQKLKDYITMCNSAASEYLALIALENRNKILARNLQIIQDNLEILDEFFKKYNELFEWIKPNVGSIGFVKIKFSDDAEKFCIDLVNKKNVLLLPGTVFDYDNLHFRIGFGKANMEQALNKLEEYLNEEIL